MKTWTPQQNAIFNYFSRERGNLVVRARAGTGKTTTILEGIDRAPDPKILLAAFNKKIAEELKTKLRNPRAEVKTLHSLGFGYVRRNWSGVRLDDERGLRLARSAAGETAPDPMVTLVRKLAALGKNVTPDGRLNDLTDLAVQFDLQPDEDWEEEGWTTERIATAAGKAMTLSATARDGAVDFDDMVFVPVRNGWVRGWFDLVVIDEAQDMNQTQLRLALGSVKRGGRIVVVGDDRQAIYGFRGADSDSIDRLKLELRAREQGLTVTFRCPRTVVDYAKTLVPDYEAAPSAPAGSVTQLPIEKLGETAQPGDFVLSRKNAPLVKVCLSFLRRGTRAKIEGKDIGKTLLALVRKGAKLGTLEAFLEWLSAWEEREVAKLMAMKKESAEKRAEMIADQAETLRVLSEGLATIRELEARVSDLFDDVAAGGGAAFVTCSSIHRAKGLERERVYLLRDTLYPGGRTSNREEQNIEYVGVTRAKEMLVWVNGEP